MQHFFFGNILGFNWVRFLLILYFGSHDKNEKGKCTKGTTKYSQYDVTMTMINELQPSN